MSAKKAKLVVTLRADDTVVAEVEDAALWQQVLSAIHTPTGEASKHPIGHPPEPTPPPAGSGSAANPISKMAKKIGVTDGELRGAVDPSSESPYLQLDRHCWEAFKKQTPLRGRGAMSPTAIAGTLLWLWFQEAGLGNPTQAQTTEILRTIGVADKNPSRGVKSSPWLQGKPGGVIVVNPAQISKAITIAKSFCTKNWKAKGDDE